MATKTELLTWILGALHWWYQVRLAHMAFLLSTIKYMFCVKSLLVSTLEFDTGIWRNGTRARLHTCKGQGSCEGVAGILQKKQVQRLATPIANLRLTSCDWLWFSLECQVQGECKRSYCFELHHIFICCASSLHEATSCSFVIACLGMHHSGPQETAPSDRWLTWSTASRTPCRML